MDRVKGLRDGSGPERHTIRVGSPPIGTHAYEDFIRNGIRPVCFAHRRAAGEPQAEQQYYRHWKQQSLPLKSHHGADHYLYLSQCSAVITAAAKDFLDSI